MALLLGSVVSANPVAAAPPLARRAQLASLVPRLGVSLRFEGLVDGLSALGPARRGATIAAWLSWPLGSAPQAGPAVEDARGVAARQDALERRRSAWQRRAVARRAAAAATGPLDERVAARLAADEAQAELDAITGDAPDDANTDTEADAPDDVKNTERESEVRR